VGHIHVKKLTKGSFTWKIQKEESATGKDMIWQNNKKE
jgi:hypothetical protein